MEYGVSACQRSTPWPPGTCWFPNLNGRRQQKEANKIQRDNETRDNNQDFGLVWRDAYLSFLLPHRGLEQTFVVFDFPRFVVGLAFLPRIEFRDAVERQLCFLVGSLKKRGKQKKYAVTLQWL